jgi:hypothetical protein
VTRPGIQRIVLLWQQTTAAQSCRLSSLKIAKGHWHVYEVPTSYWGRTYVEGKKITWKDGLTGL